MLLDLLTFVVGCNRCGQRIFHSVISNTVYCMCFHTVPWPKNPHQALVLKERIAFRQSLKIKKWEL